MMLLPPALDARLRANAYARRAALAADEAEPDPPPIVKFFAPVGAATWLATELDADGDTLFGLADLGFRCPELGSFSLAEIAALRLPFGLAIERDLYFESDTPLSHWADAARVAGSISAAEPTIARAASARASVPLPPSDPGDGRACPTTHRIDGHPDARRVPAASQTGPASASKERGTGTHKE